MICVSGEIVIVPGEKITLATSATRTNDGAFSILLLIFLLL